MAYSFIEPRLGLPPIGTIVSVASAGVLNSTGNLIGTIAKADDPTLGEAEFILLPGVASNAVGLVCVRNPSAKTVTVATSSMTYAANPVCVSMTANSSLTALSWYQTSGVATVAKTATKVSPNVAVYISGTAGKVQSTLATGLNIYGARSVNTATIASATGTVLVVIDRGHIQGSKT